MSAGAARHQGFTLIEVLIALAIIAIAMTAIIKTTGDAIRNTAYLKTKTTAYWVAINVLNETLVGAAGRPQAGETKTGRMEMFDREWPWEMSAASTGNGRIRQLFVRVFSSDDATQPRMVLMTYA